MLAAESYENLIEQLSKAFIERYSRRPRVFATGLLLFQPQSDFSKREIVPHLEYLDANSANYIDFFCVGFKATPLVDEQPKATVAKSTDSWWTFYPAKFAEFKRGLEADFSYDKKSWRYSGGTDFLLFNAIFDHQKSEVELGFETIMAVDLEAAKNAKAIDSVVKFLELVVRLAEVQDLNDPVYKMSDQLALHLGRKEICDVFFDLLPFKFGERAKKFEHFAVQ